MEKQSDTITAAIHNGLSAEDERELRDAVGKIYDSLFMTMSEYEHKIAQGLLVRKKMWEDDFKFHNNNPGHPLAYQAGGTRMGRADTIRNISRKLNHSLPAEILHEVHKQLFDCNAAVRVSLAQALFYAGSAESVGVLEELLAQETASNMVKNAASMALRRCRMRAEKPSAEFDDNTIILFTNELELVSKVFAIADNHSLKVRIPTDPVPEMLTTGGRLQIVDRVLLGKDKWDEYCRKVREIVNTEEGRKHFVIPQVFTEYGMGMTVKNYESPVRDKNFYYYIEGGNVYIIDVLLPMLIRGERADVKECVEEANRRLIEESWKK